jgi:hypothetical protein
VQPVGSKATSLAKNSNTIQFGMKPVNNLVSNNNNQSNGITANNSFKSSPNQPQILNNQKKPFMMPA